MLWLWKEKNGSQATPKKIRNIVTVYFSAKLSESADTRLEDVFHEVLKRFSNSGQFKRFAISREGLCLSSYEVGIIIEDNKSAEERNLEMLWRWKHRNDEIATAEKIWQLVDNFLNESDDDDSEGELKGTYAIPPIELRSSKATGHRDSNISETQSSNTGKEADEIGIDQACLTETVTQDSGEIQEFKKIVNSATNNNANPFIGVKNLATNEFKIHPATTEVNYYETTVKESEYKPEIGFSQQTQHQQGKECGFDEFFSKDVKRISLIGGAGYGKTEMLKRFVKAVLNNEISSLEDIEVVHHMNFRDLETNDKVSLGEILFGQLDLSPEVIEKAIKWIKANPSKFLLALDGADQYPSPDGLGETGKITNHHKKADPKMIVNSLLSGKLLPGIRILYSSREHVIRYFEGKARPQKVIALAGFNKENIEKLVRCFSGERADEMMNHLKTKSPSLLSLCSIPMFLIFSVSVLLRYKKEKPETLTEILMLVLQDAFKSEHITTNQTKTGLTIYDVIHKLKKMSYNGTKNKKVTFTKSDLPDGLTMDHFKDILIPIPGSMGNNQKLVEGHFVFLMQHQSLQEALTALYVAEMSLREFRKFVSKSVNEPHWVVVRRILCGLLVNQKTQCLAVGVESEVGILKKDDSLGEKKRILLSSLKDLIKPGWFQRKFKGFVKVQEELLEVIHAFSECGDGSADLIKSSFKEINLGLNDLTRSDCFAVATVVSHCSVLKSLSIYSEIENWDVFPPIFKLRNVKTKRLVMLNNAGKMVRQIFPDEINNVLAMLPFVTEEFFTDYDLSSVDCIQEELNSMQNQELKVVYQTVEGFHGILQSNKKAKQTSASN